MDFRGYRSGYHLRWGHSMVRNRRAVAIPRVGEGRPPPAGARVASHLTGGAGPPSPMGASVRPRSRRGRGEEAARPSPPGNGREAGPAGSGSGLVAGARLPCPAPRAGPHVHGKKEMTVMNEEATIVNGDVAPGLERGTRKIRAGAR